jgi:hypothetical protein
MQVLK